MSCRSGTRSSTKEKKHELYLEQKKSGTIVKGTERLAVTIRVRAAAARNTNSAAERNTLKSLDTYFLTCYNKSQLKINKTMTGTVS